MVTKKFCLLTLHGVGFQQAPTESVPGYADLLHQRLGKYLDASILGNDPVRLRNEGVASPVYVQSTWPPSSDNREAALARLGTWRADRRSIDISNAALTEGDAPIAHVALVYSHLEEQGSRLGSLAETVEKAAFSFRQYTNMLTAARMAITDVAAMAAHHTTSSNPAGSSLRVRVDAPPAHQLLPRTLTTAHVDAADTNPGLLATIQQIEDDVATYVCRNDMRERVRNFVREALTRILYRGDIAGIVVNAHSQGTMVAFDVLSQLPGFDAHRVVRLVTAGSPLRKYADLFCWGTDIGSVGQIGPMSQQGQSDSGGTDESTRHLTPPWTNFWDPRDPVADPLTPATWPAQAHGSASENAGTLLQWINPTTGATAGVQIEDRQIDNVGNSVGGGLQAHNYWDNEPQFVAPLAEMLRALVTPRARSRATQPKRAAVAMPAQ